MAPDDAKESVVLYPSPGMGHLVSMVELGKLFVGHGLSVTILIVGAHYNTGATAPFITRVTAANPDISFHHLPPPLSLPPNPSRHHEAHAFDLLRLTNPALLSFIGTLSSPPRAIVADLFCNYAVDVAAELRIPFYIFFTSGAGVLAAFIHLHAIHASTDASFRQLRSTKLDIPGIPPLPADHMPLPMLDRDDAAYIGFLNLSRRFPECDGIIVNTFAALEPRTVEEISAGRWIPEGRPTCYVPLYCIGPLIKSEGRDDEIRGADCLAWLDEQQRGSVVFLCFGSLGRFSAEQLKEIAVGLERSGQRFLWVVRNQPGDAGLMVAPPEPDLDELLPEGFMERTVDKGMVVKSWAPQTAVLNHEAVGGFVTHCGWNSVLEAVCAGVPMVGWPLYAEQYMNIVFLKEEMKLAVEMRGYDQGLVGADEVEEKVRWLMESEGGRELKARTAVAKEAAAAAMKEGGSSHTALLELVSKRKRGHDPELSLL